MAGRRPGAEVRPQHLFGEDREIVGDDVFQPMVQQSLLLGALDDGGQQLGEGLEQGVLILDPQRQQPVQEGMHGRQPVRR
jgi:hypothetical protein